MSDIWQEQQENYRQLLIVTQTLHNELGTWPHHLEFSQAEKIMVQRQEIYQKIYQNAKECQDLPLPKGEVAVGVKDLLHKIIAMDKEIFEMVRKYRYLLAQEINQFHLFQKAVCGYINYGNFR